MEEREEAGLEGLVGGLEFVIINVERNRLQNALRDLLRTTGMRIRSCFTNDSYDTCVLSGTGPDIMIRCRKKVGNPFKSLNLKPKTSHLPNTRLETLVFRTDDVEGYYDIQRERGVEFLTDGVVHTEDYSFVQTIPSVYTGNSLGFVEWRGGDRSYGSGDESFDEGVEVNKQDFTNNVRYLDHAATRVRAADREKSILEFIYLTNYHFDFAIYVESFNSITSAVRLSDKDFAMVFTSGISDYIDPEESGPTEKFTHNYGTRVHHMAFHTENIENTFEALKDIGQNFLVELVGSEEDGLKQTFTTPFEDTLLVNEYIHRYGDFDGFFTKSNVTRLTEAAGKQ